MATGQLQVPIEEIVPGQGEALPNGMPIQLQGVLDDSSWSNFSSQVNARLVIEHQQVSAMASKYRPFQLILCFVMAAGFLFMPISMEFGMDIEVAFQFFGIASGCFIGGVALLICIACFVTSATNKIRGESATVFAELSARQRSSNPNVSLEVKTVQQLTGFTNEGRARYNERSTNRGPSLNWYKDVRFVDVAVAGAFGMGMQPGAGMQQQFPGMPGMQPGAFPNAQQQVLAGLQQQSAFAGMQQPGFMQQQAAFGGMQQAGFPQQPGFPGMPGMPGANPLLGAGGGMEMSNFSAAGYGQNPQRGF